MHCWEPLLVSRASSWPIWHPGLATDCHCHCCCYYCCPHQLLLLLPAAALAVPQLLLLDHRLPLLLLVLLQLLHLQRQLPCKLHWAATNHQQQPLGPNDDLQTQTIATHRDAISRSFQLLAEIFNRDVDVLQQLPTVPCCAVCSTTARKLPICKRNKRCDKALDVCLTCSHFGDRSQLVDLDVSTTQLAKPHLDACRDDRVAQVVQTQTCTQNRANPSCLG